MLDGSEKDYVVYRNEREGRVYQTHKATWREWMEHENYRRGLVLLVDNLTHNEARQFCQLTRED